MASKKILDKVGNLFHNKKKKTNTTSDDDSSEHGAEPDVNVNTDHSALSEYSAMGKSNKFDCTNRRSEGVELGKSIASATLKEVEKAKKDATRLATKARKASSASSGSMNSADFEPAGIDRIDLIVPSKALTDDGVAAMVEGLQAAMEAGTRNASITLVGLDLRDNKLTTRSLAMLAPVINLAQNDIHSIVLCDNNITVATDEQAQQWKTFLTSFKSCKVLRRLDLSNNVELGVRALEILCEVHCHEPAIDPIRLGGDGSVYALDDVQESDEAPPTEDNASSVKFDRMTAGGFLSRRAGLRAIPYISLRNISVSDAGALWLSYILEDHYLPNQLTNEINAAPATSAVAAYQQDAHEGGIDWFGWEKSLDKEGKFLLNKTELVRKQNQMALESAGSELGETVDTEVSQSRRASFATVASRRASIRSINTDDGGEREVSEIDSVRKRIQRHIIENRGVGSVDLWIAAFSVVLTSRKITIFAPPAGKRTVYAGPCLFRGSDLTIKKPSDKQRLDSVATTKDYASPNPAASKAGKSASTPPPNAVVRSYAATLGDRESALTEVTNTPITPKHTFVAHRKGAFSEGSDLASLSDKLSKVYLKHTDSRPERFLEYQQEKQERDHFEYRNTANATQLPVSVFGRILAFTLATPADWKLGSQGEVVNKDGTPLSWSGRSLLSDTQMREAYNWGQKRETLAKEREWAKMTDSSQKWMLLDAVRCIAYES